MTTEPVEALSRELSVLVALLKAHGETHWSGWLGADLERVQRGDVVGAAEHVLSAYGGMGSLNDLILCRANGHEIHAAEEDAVNDRLWDLRHRVWEAARATR